MRGRLNVHNTGRHCSRSPIDNATKGLTFKPLVAFSGTVKDPDSGQEHTETSLNGISSGQIVNAFKTPTYRILIVANKFQTGFDEPLLHTMHAYPVSSQGGRLLIVLFVPPRIGRRCRAYGDSQQPVNWMSWDATG